MTIWLAIIPMCAAISAILWWGSRSLAAVASAAVNPLQNALFTTRLAEIKSDEAAGILSVDEARAQEAEVSRRILANAKSTGVGLAVNRPLLSLAVALAVPLIALAIYARVGAPSLPDVPQALRLDQAEANGDIAAMVYKVENHLAKNPRDATGWELLIPNYMTMGRFAEAVVAHRQLLSIRGPSADGQANLAETMMMRDQGTLSEEAKAAASAAVALDKTHSKGRYYEALALQQDGKGEEARMKFAALLQDTPSDAPWRGAIERQLQMLTTAKAQPPALSDEQMKAGSAMTNADQTAMIAGMVEGLAAKLVENPNDLTGSLRLIRARMVLKQTDLAKSNLVTARKTFANDAKALADINALARELQLP